MMNKIIENDKVLVSEEIDVNKTNKSPKCIIWN